MYKEGQISTEKFKRINFEEKITQIQSVLKYTPNSLKSLEGRLEALNLPEGRELKGREAASAMFISVVLAVTLQAVILFCCGQIHSLLTDGRYGNNSRN